MPSPSERSRNNVRAGIFVTVAIALAVGTTIAVGGFWRTLTETRNLYTVTFRVSEGIKSLEKGSQVRVGGLLMGDVKAVRPRYINGGVFETIEVDFDLNENVRLYEDARIVVSTALIGSEAWLEIYSVGTSTEPRVLPGGELEGISAPGGLAALLGPDNADKANQVIDDLAATSHNVRGLSEEIVQVNWPAWSDRIDQVMDWASRATTKIDAVLDEGQGFLADTRGLVNENRGDIRTIVTNVERTSDDLQAVMKTVRTETVEKVHRLLGSGQSGLEQSVAVLETLRDDYEVWATDITETLAGARLTAQQLKLASIEVRRSPWKLLYRPSRTELDHELLYEAARAFALAGSDLKATSASAQRILEHYESDLDDETVGQLKTLIDDSMNRYSAAQQHLVDVLLED